MRIAWGVLIGDDMDRIDRLTIKAMDKAEPPMKPWERATMQNPYAGRERDELMELLSTPREDWRKIVQACVWTGGG